MKTLLFTLLLLAPLFSSNTTPPLMECEMVLEMFKFSVEQGNTITKEQVEGVISACDGLAKHQQTVDEMKELILTL